MTITEHTNISAQIEGDLIATLDEWHSLPETWDHELDAQIHRWYSNPPRVFPKRDHPYFSPSSANSCPRELYVKAKGAKRDVTKRQPHQARWTSIGTAIGDMIQRDLLFIEKHFEVKTGNAPRFRFLRDREDRPMFEDFAKTNALVNHNGESFYLYGAPDGIMEYTTDSGEKIRVGLEIKSKQTTPARTSLYSMRQPDESHAKQCVAYSHMFGCDYYVILYVNAAKQSWNVSDEQYAKTPDVRAFCTHITDDDRAKLFDRLAEITKAIRTESPPKLDLEEWTFNNYKDAVAQSLTDEEMAEMQTINTRAQHSNLPAWKKRQYEEAVKTIEELRRGKGD